MTEHTIAREAAKPVHRSFRLTRASESAALHSQVRPALVLPEREGRALLEAARREDVSHGGRFSTGPAGIQVWSDPSPGGTGQHLGSVDWIYDTPVRHYITIYRVLVTGPGAAAGATTAGILDLVLALAGLDLHGEPATLPAPPRRDPFRSAARRLSH